MAFVGRYLDPLAGAMATWEAVYGEKLSHGLCHECCNRSPPYGLPARARHHLAHTNAVPTLSEIFQLGGYNWRSL